MKKNNKYANGFELEAGDKVWELGWEATIEEITWEGHRDKKYDDGLDDKIFQQARVAFGADFDEAHPGYNHQEYGCFNMYPREDEAEA